MKNKIRRIKKLPLLASLAVGIIGITLLAGGKSPARYVAHEWGTFTSVQGGDGGLLDWRPLESSRLPKFVYNWQHPGLNRHATANFIVGKAAMFALQRMETPVIYFYSEEKQTVDVSVQFPKGAITEWYPQACQIGPSSVPIPPAIATLDSYAHKAGAKPSFTFASLLGSREIKESLLRWGGVEILPTSQNGAVATSLPTGASGSHYFAARDTDSAYVRMYSLAATNPAPEHEKFLFYRGVGNFATPLRVTMDENDGITLSNTGPEPLTHLFVVGVENQSGRVLEVARLAPGEQRIVAFEGAIKQPLEEAAAQLGNRMAEALVKEGLYQREASAMVHTWKDSWFEEDGLRVLYVLPRSWTEQTLPLTLEPAPRELVRVMVGRAELLSPARVQALAESLRQAHRGNAQEQERVVAAFRKLGRFSQPALQLVTRDLDAGTKELAWNLFQTAATPADKSVARKSGG